MQRGRSFLFALALLIPFVLTATEFYKLQGVRRLDQDLYRSGKLLVETRYCYHYTYGETAILRYEGSGEYSGSSLIWEDDSSCEVKKIVSNR